MVNTLTAQDIETLVRIPMTYEQYLEGFDDNVRVEWANGEAIVHMPSSEPHQIVVVFLAKLLGLYVEIRELGLLLTAPFELKLPTGASREPDILFIRNEHFDRRTTMRLVGAADLVIEVQSRSTASYDLDEKLKDYQRSAVPEYWAIDPRPGRRVFRPFVLSPTGRYEEVPLDDDGRYFSRTVSGFWLKPDWFWEEPLPSAYAALKQIMPDRFR